MVTDRVKTHLKPNSLIELSRKIEHKIIPAPRLQKSYGSRAASIFEAPRSVSGKGKRASEII